MPPLTTFTVSHEHPSLQGHFPGEPILPGVLLLDETLRAVEATDPACGLWRIGRAKFLKPVRPGETLELQHEHLPNGTVHFTVTSHGGLVAEGLLEPVRVPG